MAPAHHPGAGPVRMRRRWRALLLMLAAFFTTALIVLYSETALRWGVLLATEMLVKPLSVSEVHGRLAGPFTLSGIEYQDRELQLSLDQLTVDWKPSKLFIATAHVTELRAKGLSIVQQPRKAEAPAATGPFTLPQVGFPLKFIIDEATVEQITLERPAQTEPLAITKITLQAETSLNTLQLRTLSLDSDWLQLGVNGSIRPRQNYRIDLSIGWSIPQQDTSPWQGKGTIRGDIRNLAVQQQLASPFVATLTLKARDILDELTWQTRLDIPKVASSQLPYPISPAFSVGGVLKAQGDIRSLKATSEFAGQIDTVGPVEGSLDGTVANQQLHLTRLLIKRQKQPARIEASGDINLTAPLRYQIQAQWQALTWPQKTPAIKSDSGSFNLSGENKEFQFDGGFELAGAQIPKGEWRLQGSGSAESIKINTLKGNTLDGTISGDATISLVPHLSWQAKLNGKSLNPATKWPQWPGRLAFAAGLSGQFPAEGLELAVALPSLSGTLRGRELQGHTEGTWRRGVAELTSLELKVGSARLTAQGQLDKELAFSWKMDARDVADLLPQAQGSLKSEGKLSGPLATPRIAFEVEGKTLAIADYHAEQLHADIALDLQKQVPSALILQVEQLRLPGIPQQSVTLKANGPLVDHRITLESRSAKQSLNLAASAGYSEGGWGGTLNRLQIDDESLGHWELAQKTAFSLQANDFNLEELCLIQAEANFCATGQWATSSGLSASLRSARFPLQLLRPYLPRRVGIEGELDGKASLAMAPQRPPRLEAGLTLGQGRFMLFDPESENEALSLTFVGVVLQLGTSAAGTMDGELVLSLSESDRVVLGMQTSLARGWPDNLMQHPLKAQLRASLRDLVFLSNVIPEVQNLQGLVDVDVTLTGTLKSPRLSGHARLDEGQIDIPRMGLKLSAVQLAATGDNSRSMDMAGRANSGDGDLTVSGQLLPQAKGAWSLELAIVGKDFEVAKIPEARMQVSPNLTVHIVGHEIRLEGELDIPNARLEPPDISLAVKSSDDVVIIGEEEAEREIWRIHTRVRMTAADSIRFIGYGFDGRIGGDLLLIDEPDSVSRGRGELHVVPGSTYKAFGQKLITERGRLNFADSPVDDPNLDIRASRTIGDVIAGINVSGTAQKPIMTLYSEPPMDQADILSYLTLGHPMNTAGQGEGERLAGAASTAGLVGGNYLAGYIGKQFGLEEARVEAEPGTQSPWVVMGKYLSPRLYVRYGVGVYEDAYSVLVRYQLTEHWQVQVEGGRSSGTDILYTFERP